MIFLTFSSALYSKNKIYNIYTKYMLHVYFLGKASVSSRLLEVKFWGSQKFHMDFLLHGGLAPLIPMLLKGQLHLGTTNLRIPFLK